MLLFAINVNDCAKEPKFDNVYGCRYSLNDGVIRVTDVIIGGKYGDVDNGCAFALRDSGARVFIADCDPFCALQAFIEVLQVAVIESVVSGTDIFRFPYR